MSILPKATLTQVSVVREGIKIVRKIFSEHTNGLTTAELYQLALREPVPQGFTGDARFAGRPDGKKGITLPPHNEHPVRSKAFLKQLILPALQGSKEIAKVVVNREITAPIPAKGKKGKITKRPTKETAGASPATPVLVKAWIWKPCTPPPPQPRKEEARKPFGAAVGVGEDWSHLNRRRQGSREGKIQRDLATMRQLQARERRERKHS